MIQKIRQDLPLGSIIRSIRISTHMTQTKVVTQLQLWGCPTTRSSYSRIEIGQYNVRVSELVALKEIFGVSYDAFFPFEGTSDPGE